MRRGVNGFVPERLVQVLEARRLSQSTLASMVGVSPTTISNWRSGAQTPAPDALARLASVVNIEPEWFTRPPLARSTVPLFRSNASAHVAARAKLSSRLQWGQELAAAAEEFVDFPAVALPQRDFAEPESITQSDLEASADECREKWKLGRGPIQDLMLAVEGAGVLVFREQTDIAQIEGLSAWSLAMNRPMILLSADKDNAYRSRFDLGHEVGHLVCHRHIERTTDKERHNMLERQAHQFSGALLMPAETFAREVPSHPTLDDLVLLKVRWGASVAAIIMRLHALGIIDSDEKLSLFKRRSARWGAKAEPYDSDRAPEAPRLLRRSIDLIVSGGVMPLDGLQRHVGFASVDIESLAGLPEGYFGRAAHVVDLARLRTEPLARAKSASAESNAPSQILPFRPRSGA